MRRIIDSHVHIDKFDFTKPIDPTKLPEMEVVPDELVGHLNSSGVEKAVILQHPESAINDTVAQTVASDPDRFRGAMIIPLDERDSLSEMERWRARGLTVIKTDMFGVGRLYPGTQLDSPLFESIYAKAEELGIVMAIDPFWIGEPTYQPEAIGRMVAKYPGVKFVICHLGVCQAQALADPAKREQWQRMTALAAADNVWFDIAAMPDMFDPVEPYPYQGALALIREFTSTYGSHKILFGSDILGELRLGAYQDFIDMYEDSDLFSDKEKDQLFFENADAVYFGA
ncbi:amidohydrolase family protein [Demequina capsici]|uniref:Amidohydrolase family protein n=1 Tax=Demequina capsici TaxID=3075620 RepID=A0AA96F6A3_9MICO|nr:amidohydrolase family protein [Demequina sp. OYTSA14]WNM23597.1 amidohydrolase family protein [Demequina sp. OYTSA14]